MVSILALSAVLSGSFEVPIYTRVLPDGHLLIQQPANQFVLTDQRGRIVDKLDVKNPDLGLITEGTRLFDPIANTEVVPIVYNNRITMQPVNRPELKIINGNSLEVLFNGKTSKYPLVLRDRYKGLDSVTFSKYRENASHHFSAILLGYTYVRAEDWPLIVTITPGLPTDNGPGDTYSLILDKDSLTALGEQGENSKITYADDRYLLGIFGADQVWTGSVRHGQGHIFLFDLKKREQSILPNLEPEEWKAQDRPSGEFYLRPAGVSSDGSAILFSTWEILYKPGTSKPSTNIERVTISKENKMSILKKVMVGWTEIRPTKVVSAYRDFAVLQGEDSGGKTITFTYRYN